MIYTTCRYAPEEIIRGFGEDVKRLNPSVKTFTCADGCGHPNLCSFVKAMIEEVITKEIKELVITDCCDANRRAYDILLSQNKLDFLYFLPLPHKREGREIALFAKELKRFTDAYALYSGKQFDITKAIEAYDIQKQDRPVMQDEPFIRISGAHGGSHLIEEVERVFPDIKVVNDTCSGNRYLSLPAQSEDDFYLWYAQALLNQSLPCMRMWYNGGRSTESNSNALGTILHTIKFCDYYHFEYMEEKSHTELPLLKIETDTTPASNGQLLTRIEAFREELGMMNTGKKGFCKNMRYVAGLDSGSASTDVVIMNADCKIIGKSIVPTGSGASHGAKHALDLALEEAGITEKELDAIVTTGYGRETLGIPSTSVTEITCHARGANFLYPKARTVVDIGGQDSKVILIDEEGSVKNFVMNDKCAAGTGRFLEMQARALQMSMDEMVEKGLEWKKEVSISSMCTVFAESEVVSLVAQNIAVEDIIHGLNNSIAMKTASLVNRLGGEKEFIMTGGVAHNAGVVKCLEEALGATIFVSKDAQICGAIGAALIALGK